MFSLSMRDLILLFPFPVSKLINFNNFFRFQIGKPHNVTCIIKFEDATRNNSSGKMVHVGIHGLIIKLFDKFCKVIVIVMTTFNSKFGFFKYGFSLMITT
jgi:hypothetical protein